MKTLDIMADWRFRVQCHADKQKNYGEEVIDAVLELESDINEFIGTRLYRLNKEYGSDLELIDEERDVDATNVFADPNTPREEVFARQARALETANAILRGALRKQRKERIKVVKDDE